MGNLLFVGNRETGFFTEQIAERFDCNVEYISSNGHIEQQVNDILFVPHVKYIVYDISQYIDEPEEIRDVILKIKNCNTALPVIYAPGYLLSTHILVILYESGISEFIIASDLADQRSQLEKCILGYYSENGIDELNALISIKEQEEQLKSEFKYITIGVAGSMSRIGTTTQALHIVKYCIAKGYKACYIQLNNSDYIDSLKEWWGADQVDESTGKLIYEGIDHFYKIEQLPEVKKLGYDFYIYDYGSVTGHFNRESFLEKDIQIFVLGFKSQEMPASYKILQSNIYLDVKYIFSYGDELTEEDVFDLMGEERIQNTIAPKRCIEPYKLFDPDIYEKILPLEDHSEASEPKKKKSFFHKLGGRKTK